MQAHGGRESESELADLMTAYQSGSLHAFETLYGRLSPRLLGYLTSLTWDRSEAEDLLQETFLQIHRSRRTYQPGRAVVPWTFAIARHTYLMDRRARGRRAKLESRVSGELPDIPVPAEMERYAERRDVLAALNALNEGRREAVLLHHVWGLTFAEVGALLGIGEGAAKLRAHRAIRALREALGGED